MDIRVGTGSLPVRSLHLQNCSTHHRGHGTAHSGKWVNIWLCYTHFSCEKSWKHSHVSICFLRLLHHRNADWVPVFPRARGRCRGTTEEEELNPGSLRISLQSSSTVTSRDLWTDFSVLALKNMKSGYNFIPMHLLQNGYIHVWAVFHVFIQIFHMWMWNISDADAACVDGPHPDASVCQA